ncbi:hypothetical protein B8W96_12295, partial [Lentilactobacillus parakefiri]
PQFVPQDIDPNDPLASSFEYTDEDPFAAASAENDASANAEQELSEELDMEDSNEVLIAFARLYSGTLKVGSKISVLGPKF